MAKLKGKHTFKEVLDVEGLIAAGELTEYFNFISGYEGNPVQHYVLEHSGMYIEYDYFGTGIYFGYLTPPDNTMNLVYYTRWQNERLRYVDFGEGVNMSDRLSSWVLANADPVVDPEYSIKTSTLTAIADSIRAKTGGSDPILTEDMASEIEGIDTAEPWDESFTVKEGAAIIPVVEAPENDIIFIDYDGKILYSYSVEEAQALTELPPLPEHEGLICQGWNWTLEEIKEHNREIIVGAIYDTEDGKTHIHITLQDGRTSPMLGLCPNGTVTVDWGDGTEPDTLTGTSLSSPKYTQNHQYAKAGNYVIRLTVDGEAFFYAPSQYRNGILTLVNKANDNNVAYLYCVKKIHIGRGLTGGSNYAFMSLDGLECITIPSSWKSFPNMAQCTSITSITLPRSITTVVASNALQRLQALKYISTHNSLVEMGSSFGNSSAMPRITIPNSVTKLGSGAFFPIQGVNHLFIPNSIKTIPAQAFANCWGMGYYDFTSHISVPSLEATSAFSGIPADCEIRVPAALYDEWIAATNWSTYADYIVAK